MLRMNFGIQNNRRFSSKSKIEGWLFFGEMGKNEKNPKKFHKNANISKNKCPILKNSTAIFLSLNFTYNIQFLLKSEQI